jgi:DNA-binding CsgD family transcriptional regulator
MYNPDMTSFLYISNDKDSGIIKKHIDTFLTHCLGTITGAKKIQCKYFRFTLREQQIVFHLLEGRSIKSISEVLNVSDKAIYMNIRVLSAKLEKQLHPYIYNNMKMKMGSFRAHVSRT